MKKLFNAVVLLILLLSWATPVFAQGGREQPGQVVFGSDRRLEAGDIIQGDLVIFGGNLSMAEGSRIEGDAVVFGGNSEVNGEIEGDLAIIGGNARLRATARVDGDVASVGGNVDIDEGAYIRGEIVEINNFDFGRLRLPGLRAIPPRPSFGDGFGFEPVNQFLRILLALGRGLIIALVVTGIGLLVVIFLPQHTDMIGQTIREAPPTSFGVGLLTLIVGALALVLLAITCCLVPIALLVALALVLATLYGWIVVGLLLGMRILRALQKDRQPTVTAAALTGIFAVTIVQQGLMALSHLPCLGFLFWLLGAGLWLLVASTGLGAVILTRFGAQPYTGPSATRTPPPSLPPTPAPTELRQSEAPGTEPPQTSVDPEAGEGENRQ